MKVCVDLGCGSKNRCPSGFKKIGIDCYSYFKPDIVCKLGVEKIPLKDNSVDLVVAYDFLEHVPAVIYYKEGKSWKIHYPRIFLLREIYRILKPGGKFYSETPDISSQAWARDPTHCSPPWVTETWDYFTGGYGTGIANHPYGLDFAFKKLKIESVNGALKALVEK